VGHVARMVDRRTSYKHLIGKPEGMRSHGRPRHRWDDIIKMEHSDYIHLAQDCVQRPTYVNTERTNRQRNSTSMYMRQRTFASSGTKPKCLIR
jgi:hypothetical protein